VNLHEIVVYAISILVGLSGILVVAEALGFLPEWASRRLNRNRLAQTIDVLSEMGLDIDRLRRRNASMLVVEHFQTGEFPMRVQKALEPLTLKKAVGIGAIDVVQAKRYIDLMGGTTNPATAMMFARYLVKFWRDCLLDDEIDIDANIQFVVTPKAGSPILGYEFAKYLDLPFALHNGQKKFLVNPDEFRAHFDCISLPQEHGRGLIVDDSSTGGEKVLALIDDLRRFGYDALDCLIVFEPELKAARQKIRDKGVRLHSIIKV
jgi:orotate phosphoribosyltransferase